MAPRYGSGAAVINLPLSVSLYFGYSVRRGGYQLVEGIAWIPALGISYYLGVDGMSVPYFDGWGSYLLRRNGFVERTGTPK